MNDHHSPSASQLLRDATDDLTVDVDLLVRGGIARGRTVQRRHRVGTAFAAAAVVGVIGVAASVGPGLLKDDDAQPVPVVADSSPTATPSETPTIETVPAPARRLLAVTQANVADTFVELFPGDFTEPPQKEVNDAAPIVDFVWEGYGVRVGITPEEYVTGEPVGPPLERCLLMGQEDGTPCRTLRDGTVVQTMASTGPEGDGGITSNFAWAYTPDGWDVLLAAHNAAASNGSPIIDDVPYFTVDQLLEAATSDIWFEQP